MSSLTFESNNPERPLHEMLSPVPQQQDPTLTVADRFFREAEEKRAKAIEIGHVVLGGDIRRGSDTDIAIREALTEKSVSTTKDPERAGSVTGVTHFILENGDEVRRVTLGDVSHFVLRAKNEPEIEFGDREF